GNGSCGFSGDGGPATAASLDSPKAIVVDSEGNLYIDDAGNHRIRKITDGVITTLTGIGASADSENRPDIASPSCTYMVSPSAIPVSASNQTAVTANIIAPPGC